MIKCYKVLERINGNKLKSACLPLSHEYCKIYSKDELVDISLVFRKKKDAISFAKIIAETDDIVIFEARSAHLEKVDFLCCSWNGLDFEKFLFLNRTPRDIVLMKPPRGSYWAFDLFLDEEVTEWKSVIK